MYTRTMKREQFLDTKYRGRPPSTTAKTKPCYSLFLLKYILKQKTAEKYFLLHVYNYTTYTPESTIRIRHKRKRGRDCEEKKKRARVRKRQKKRSD